MFKKFILMGAIALIAAFGIIATVSAAGGFDEFGYNDKARIFNGTGSSWCLAGGQASNCVGDYSSDKLVMKWNAAWDACNAALGTDAENTATACAGAWTNNEWNGMAPGGSGSVWHYKTIWIGGNCGADYTQLPDGGYCLWGSYEVLMDQGLDPSLGSGHFWFSHVTPNGYGGR